MPFVARLAEIYFLMKRNVAHLKLNGMQKGECIAEVVAQDNLVDAQKACTKGHWLPDSTWQPSDVHKAKSRYRQALLFRLQGNPSRTRDAVLAIEAAHRLLPDDAGISRERVKILAWRDSVR